MCWYTGFVSFYNFICMVEIVRSVVVKFCAVLVSVMMNEGGVGADVI